MLIVIGGTTASGKSVLAMRLAERLGAQIVNADSRQVYCHLGILTAKPTPKDEGRVLHNLYGYLPPDRQNSVGDWLQRVAPFIDRSRISGQPLIIVGGTGLYLKALLEGLPEMPDIPTAVRQKIKAETFELPTSAIHSMLFDEDPIMAGRLRPTDRQRNLRALEVVRATGMSLADWQIRPLKRIKLPVRRKLLAILPDRDTCARRIEQRFHEMVQIGACDEIAEAIKHYPDLKSLPLSRTTGVSELLGYLEGRTELASAIRKAIVATRQYAKRQRTWFRHQAPQFQIITDVGDCASLVEQMMHCEAVGNTDPFKIAAEDC
ncbi:MAG: tRNA (adenosine(37)-N6)-dimethylallyltransferase MiaA [Pseudomonadota bacterium]